MERPYQIIGIVLVKDEDMYIEQVIRNIVDFCDEILIDDNGSQDQTYPILQRLAAEYPSIQLYQSDNLHHSHTLIERFANTNTWVFGVDGDEIYDPVGLKKMYDKLQQGEFQKQWVIFGNVLHCVGIDPVNKIAKGHLAPPARSMTKLYNFSIIEQWLNGPERLHSGDLVFKPGYDMSLRYRLDQQISWDDAYFRCLHSVFVRRSSLQQTLFSLSRWAPAERMQQAKDFAGKGWVHTMWLRLLWKNTLYLRTDRKYKHYAVGPVHQKDASNFFPENAV
ncbi:MAG: glycosyltransferase [Lentisphaerae bacterium]|nr:glycosyltransferase [Lentisphaerota bacterium]